MEGPGLLPIKGRAFSRLTQLCFRAVGWSRIASKMVQPATPGPIPARRHDVHSALFCCRLTYFVTAIRIARLLPTGAGVLQGATGACTRRETWREELRRMSDEKRDAAGLSRGEFLKRSGAAAGGAVIGGGLAAAPSWARPIE